MNFDNGTFTSILDCKAFHTRTLVIPNLFFININVNIK